MSDNWLTDILDCFDEISEWVPGGRTLVGEILLGQIPLVDAGTMYDLADRWGAVAQRLSEAVDQIVDSGDFLVQNWHGDVAAYQFAGNWQSFLPALMGTAEGAASMQSAVQSFGLEVEMMKFMAALNLIILLVTIIIAIATSPISLGGSLSAIGPAFAAAREAIYLAARKAIQTIAQIGVRSAVRMAARAATQFALHELPRLAMQGLKSSLRNLLPKNMLARTLSRQLAGQWTRRMLQRQLLRQLYREMEREAGRLAAKEARQLYIRSVAAMSRKLAAEIEQQLLQQFGRRAATGLAERFTAEALGEFAGREMFQQLSQATMRDLASKMAETTFARELAKYLGVRVGFGAGLLGGGNLFFQGVQIGFGNRSSLDFGSAGTYALQGGVFGLGMWGGLGGHVLGSGLAGGAFGLGAQLTDGKEGVDWAEVGHSAASGAIMGGFMGVQNNLHLVSLGRLGIGQDVMALPAERGVSLHAVDSPHRTGLVIREGSVSWRVTGPDGEPQHAGIVDRHGNVVLHAPEIDPIRYDLEIEPENITDVTAPGRPEPPPEPPPAAATVPAGEPHAAPAPHPVTEPVHLPVAPSEHASSFDRAALAIEVFRASDADVQDIVRALADVVREDGTRGYSAAEIALIKRHLFIDSHLIDEGQYRPFDPHPGIVDAWTRLAQGRPLDTDLVLLAHELTETKLLQAHPDWTTRQAHEIANREHPWSTLVLEPPGEGIHGGVHPVRPGPEEPPAVRGSQMFRDATEEELARLGVGRASLADLGAMHMSLEEQYALRPLLPRTAMVEIERIRFTQRSISVVTSDGISIHDLAQAMRADGWRGEPIHVVRWGDGTLTSLDNRRLQAALEAGLDRVPAIIHSPGEHLHQYKPRPLSIEIRELPDGRWVVGGDEGRVVFARGHVPTTFGQMALFRAAEQRSLLPGRLFGTDERPVFLGSPPPPHPEVVLEPGEHAALQSLHEQARTAADAIMVKLRAAISAATERLRLPEPITLVGEDHRVKTYDSMARKYHDEAKIRGRSIEAFIDKDLNDAVRFSIQLPGGPAYTAALRAVLGELRDAGFEVGDTKNFWLEGNRYYGLNVTTIHTAEFGHPIEVQFPTEASWRAGKLTHDLYEVVRREDELAPRQVHGFLSILEINKRFGLADQIPGDLALEHPPMDRGFAYWVSKHPDVWREYVAWLGRNGLEFTDVLRGFHLDWSDIPVREAVGRSLGEHNVELLRGVRGEGGHIPGGRDGGPGDPLGRRTDLEPQRTGVALRPTGGQEIPLQRRQPGEPAGRGPGEGGAGHEPGDRGPGSAAGGGDHLLDLPVEGRATTERGVVPPEGEQARGTAAELARGPSRPLPHTGAELRAQVHELADAALRRLGAATDPVTIQRAGELMTIKGLADELQAAADAARAAGNLHEVVARVRALSAAVEEYAHRYGGGDLEGVDPLDAAAMSQRGVSVDPMTHRFHVIDQATIVAKIGDVLGPAFEPIITDLLPAIVPMEIEHITALRPELAADPRILRQVTQERPLGFRDPYSGTILVEPNSGGLPRAQSAVASTMLHEMVHALQIDSREISAMIDMLPESERALASRLVRFERELQSFALEQHFQRALAGHEPSALGDPRIPRSDGLAEVAAATPEDLAEIVRSRYLPQAGRDLAGILERYPELTPARIVDAIRGHLDAGHREPLTGPVTREIMGRADPVRQPAHPGPAPLEFARGDPPGPEPDLPPAEGDAPERPGSVIGSGTDAATPTLSTVDNPAGRGLDRFTEPVRRVVEPPLFGFEEYLRDPAWLATATRVEQGIGAHLFNQPEVVAAARTAVADLRAAMERLTQSLHPELTRPQIEERVARTFFMPDAPDSAGQVGWRRGLEAILTDPAGADPPTNVRELMTAFFNAAYGKRGSDTFVELLLQVRDAGRLDLVADVVDVGLLRRLGSADPLRLEDSLQILTDADRATRNLAEFDDSRVRRWRSDAEQRQLASTPQRYEDLQVPLTERERGYLESHRGRPLRPDSRMRIREGAVLHELTGEWAERMRQLGFPVQDGVSGTATRMLISFRLLGHGTHVETGRFLGGLLGWMLPGPDHSLTEVLRGADLAGVGELRPVDTTGLSAMDIYRWLPLELGELRHYLPEHLLPHEALYLERARTGGFTEVTPEVLAETLARFEAFRSRDLAEWLRYNGIDATDPEVVRALQDGLTEAHAVALAVYTRYGYSLLNTMIREVLDPATTTAEQFRQRLLGEAEGYLTELARGERAYAPEIVTSLMHEGDGPLSHESPRSDLAKAWIDAHQRLAAADAAGDRTARRGAQQALAAAWQAIEERLDAAMPALRSEMRWHVDMIYDALTRLPTVGGHEPVYAFRGDGIGSAAKRTLYGTPDHPAGTTNQVVSMSRKLSKAISFMRNDPDEQKALVIYVLSGGSARDIAPFSWFPKQREVILPPGVETYRVDPGVLRPGLHDQVRAALDAAGYENAEIIVMAEVPGGVTR